jgi:hypothetical protein
VIVALAGTSVAWARLHHLGDRIGTLGTAFAAALIASLQGDHAEAALLIETTIAEAAARARGPATYAHRAVAIMDDGLCRCVCSLAVEAPPDVESDTEAQVR